MENKLARLRIFTIGLIATTCMLLVFFGIVAVDANTAYTGFGEQHIIIPSYNFQSGIITGRILGSDYTITLPDGDSMENIANTLYMYLPSPIKAIYEAIVGYVPQI